MNPRKADAKRNVIPVRFSDRALEAVKRAGEKEWGPRSDSEIIRLAAEIGLAVLAETNYDVAGIVARFALNSPTTPASAESAVEARLSAADAVESRLVQERAARAKAGDKAVR